jgi:hypothetical protein
MSSTQTYRSECGRFYFRFQFVNQGSYYDIYCTGKPSLSGRDSDPHKTHIYGSGKICFVSGREPRTMSSAQGRAKEWAEYFLEYIRTGIPQ